MELTQTAEYALRAMAYLALLDGSARAPALDLSRGTGIPAAYLSKVMRRLVLAGLVTSQKGHGGGFSLARAPAKVRFSDILAAAGYDLLPDRCAFGWGRCNPTHPCPLHPAWSRLNEQFNGWASTTTLDDLQRLPALHGGSLPRTVAPTGPRDRQPKVAARGPAPPRKPRAPASRSR